jgi:hypothetical protein
MTPLDARKNGVGEPVRRLQTFGFAANFGEIGPVFGN